MAQAGQHFHQARDDPGEQHGFLEVYNGAGHYDAQKIFENWADPLDIVDPGTGIKSYPCCGGTHASLDAMITLRDRCQPEIADVESIHGRVHARRLAHINRADPQSDLDAKFSIHYCLARALMEGRVVVEHFENDAHRDPAVRAMMKKITVEPYVNPPPDIGDHYAVDIVVTMKSGQSHQIHQARPCGRIPAEPVPPARRKSKFESCAGRVLPAERVAQLHAALEDLENIKSIQEVALLLMTRPDSPAKGGAQSVRRAASRG